MTSYMITTAFQMQQALKEIPDRISCIGYSESHYHRKFQSEVENMYYSMIHEEGMTHSVAIQKILQRYCFFERFVRTLFIQHRCKELSYAKDSISIPSYRIDAKHPDAGSFQFILGEEQDVISDILSQLPNATYGDQKTLTTKSDTNVRQGVDLTYGIHWTLPEHILQRLSSQIIESWTINMEIDHRTKVITKPYKLNFYGPGGHFKAHKDTPSSKFIGTAIVVLTDTSDGKLVVEGHKVEARVDVSAFNRQRERPLIMFFSDTTHEVTKLTYGYRCTLTFEMFRDTIISDDQKEDMHQQSFEPNNDNTLISVLEDVINTTPNLTFGFLLYSKYVFEENPSWNNLDAALLAFLQNLPKTDWKIEVSPVLVRSKSIFYTGELESPQFDPLKEFTTKVYPCSNAEFQIIIQDITYKEQNKEQTVQTNKNKTNKEETNKEQDDNEMKESQSRWSHFFDDRSKFENVPFLLMHPPHGLKDQDLKEQNGFTGDLYWKQMKGRFQHLKESIQRKYAIYKQEEDECERTGNESRPNQIDSLYIHYGVLVQRIRRLTE